MDTTRSTHVEADLIKVHRMIGALVLLIGVLLLVGGTTLVGVGTVGSARYRRASGRFIRAVSTDDQRYYRDLKRSATTGRLLQALGVAVCTGGLIVVVRPAALTPLMVRAGVETRRDDTL